jgi:hypothetical protein
VSEPLTAAVLELVIDELNGWLASIDPVPQTDAGRARLERATRVIVSTLKATNRIPDVDVNLVWQCLTAGAVIEDDEGHVTPDNRKRKR